MQVAVAVQQQCTWELQDVICLFYVVFEAGWNISAPPGAVPYVNSTNEPEAIETESVGLLFVHGKTETLPSQKK